MAHDPVVDIGGIRVAKRGIPAWLIVVAVGLLSVATWYLLSFSSTPYNGSYPKPEVVVEEPAGGGGGH